MSSVGLADVGIRGGGSALLSGDIDRYGRRLVTLDSPHPSPVYGRTHFITLGPIAPCLASHTLDTREDFNAA